MIDISQQKMFNMIETLPCFSESCFSSSFFESSSVENSNIEHIHKPNNVVLNTPVNSTIKNTLIIQRIKAGQSSLCFLVEHQSNKYFVKYNNQYSQYSNNDIVENHAFNSEVIASQAASNMGLSPKIIYWNEHWLVSEFIEGKTLDVRELHIYKKIDIALDLLIKCHSIKHDLPPLQPQKIIEDTIKTGYFSDIEQNFTRALFCKFPLSDPGNNLVFSHGDINFSNIISTKNQAWLVDYECACIAEREFEIAMFLAINTLNSLDILYAISSYEKLSGYKLKQSKLNGYLLYSYLLNGLWYIQKSREKKSSTPLSTELKTFALKQFTLLNKILPHDLPHSLPTSFIMR